MSVGQSSMGQFLLNQVALSNAIRRLWVDSNMWVRSLIFSILFDIGDRDVIQAQLRKNADAFATLFEQFYGQQTGQRVRTLFLNYMQSVEAMIQAYKDNDLPAVAVQNENLYRFADDLSQLFANINRYLDKMTLQAMLYELINLTEYEIMHIHTGEFEQSAENYDEIMNQAYRVSDELTYGVLRHFQV